MTAAEVVLPLKWNAAGETGHAAAVAELTGYLSRLRLLADVTVVDGSSPGRLAAHREAWSRYARILEPDPAIRGSNGKVVGALTGVAAARHEAVVLADDDVRYDAQSLRRVVSLLDTADLVRPRNVFPTWPWHACWDGSRSLLNRALGVDWPGTFGLRRDVVLAMGGWDADVLFENLELVRTLRAAGGRVIDAPDLLVPRLPPTAAHFWSQRVRQAYDDLAQPLRLVTDAAVLPAVVVALARCPRALGYGAAALVGLAEVGRLRGGAGALVPRDVPLWAPLWVLERGVCVWLALGRRARGGVPYHGRRLTVAAHSPRTLRRRLADRRAEPAAAAGLGRTAPSATGQGATVLSATGLSASAASR